MEEKKEKMEENATESGSSSSKAWHSYISDKIKLPSSMAVEGGSATPTAIIGSLHHRSSSHLQSLQGVVSESSSHFSTYEDAFFKHCKEGLVTALQYPAATAGITLGALFLLAKGPRRFLLRHTVGRLQSEEARFVKAEKNVKNLSFSVDLMKKESKKLLERATLAEKEMTNGQANLMNVGKQIRQVTKSVDQAQAQAADLVDLLREIPGREALRLRAEVASVASLIKQQRTVLAKRSAKLAEMGVPV